MLARSSATEVRFVYADAQYCIRICFSIEHCFVIAFYSACLFALINALNKDEYY